VNLRDDFLSIWNFHRRLPTFRDTAATQSSLVLANLPAMLQMPDFHFSIDFLIKSSENSPDTWLLIRNLEKEVSLMDKRGAHTKVFWLS
jgi:hypothetical protein